MRMTQRGNLIVEVSGEDLNEKAMKVNAVRTFWLPAIHNAGGYGEWDIWEVKNPYRVVEEFESNMQIS